MDSGGFNPRTPCGVRHRFKPGRVIKCRFQSTHSLRSATAAHHRQTAQKTGFNPRTPCGVRLRTTEMCTSSTLFQSTHSLRSATLHSGFVSFAQCHVSIHALLAECDSVLQSHRFPVIGFNPRTPCGVRRCQGRFGIPVGGFQSTHSLRSATYCPGGVAVVAKFQSTHSLRSATAPDLIHCYSTEQIILCANLPKKTVIARLLFLSIYLSIFYSQCITPIADLPGNSCELEVGAQAMFNSL